MLALNSSRLRVLGNRAPAFLTVALWSCSLLWLGPAHAQEVEDPAYTATIADAVREFSAQRFEEARALFKRAHELSPSARTLRGLGMTAFELRMYVRAMRELEAALADTRKALTQEQRNHANSLIAKSREFVGRVKLELRPVDATPLVDGRQPEVSADATLLLDVGQHVISATAPDHKPSNVRVRVEGGTVQVVRLLLEPITLPSQAAAEDGSDVTPAPLPTPDQASDGSLQTLAWISLAGAAVFGGLAGALWAMGDAGYAELERQCIDTLSGCSETQIDQSNVETLDLFTNVSLGLSAASGVLSVVLFAVDAGDGSADSGSAEVGLAPGRIQLRGRF